MPFTDRQIAGLKQKSSRYEKTEPGRTGLRIRVTPRGVKTWGYLYRFEGKQKRMVFGTYPVMGVAKAHSALSAAKEKLLAGIDPGAVVAAERAAERNAETMAELVTEYIQRHVRPNMKSSSAAEEERLLNREIVAHLGKRKAKEATRRDLIVLLDGIEDRGARTTRNRVAGVLSRLFRFALDRGIVGASPATGIRRLDEGKGRERFLSMEEIRSLWLGLDDIDAIPSLRLATRFALATGQRRGEILGTTWTEIDKAESVWRLSSERTKNSRPNLIPLPPFIMRLVDEADRLRIKPPPKILNRKRKDGSTYTAEPSPYLFPARIPGRSLEPRAASQALNRNRASLGIGDATFHDLRRTFATWHGEIGTPPDILSALLNHAPVGMTAKVYNRAENIEPRRRAMVVWCRWLELVIAGEFEAAKKMQGADVVSLTEVA